jgi:hypothetical protein
LKSSTENDESKSVQFAEEVMKVLKRTEMQRINYSKDSNADFTFRGRNSDLSVLDAVSLFIDISTSGLKLPTSEVLN